MDHEHELVPLTSEELTRHGIHTSLGTLRKWRATHRHPQLFVLLHRRLFIDLIQWRRMVEEAVKDRDRLVDRLRGLGLVREEEGADHE